jgi:hypothetical protein
MEISKKVVRMGIDLGKNTFHVFGVEESGSMAEIRSTILALPGFMTAPHFSAP